MYTLSLLLSSFSIISALILALSHFQRNNYPDQITAQTFGVLLVFTLAGIQLFHFNYLLSGASLQHNVLYHFLLYLVAPSFYLFSKPLLKGAGQFRLTQLLHFIPALFAFLLPSTTSLPLAFAIGSGYLLWLMRSLYKLRARRSRFTLEILVLGLALLLGFSVLVMGLSLPIIEDTTFFSLYTIAIGIAFILVNLAINMRPKLPGKIMQAAADTYVASTLNNVDCDSSLQKLNTLMFQDKIYENPQLDLTTLAQHLELSSHQLSELINSQLGKGFSRYIREQRVMAAKKMLLNEPSASVLSIGMHVGFTSQSNFYEAFREITDMTPGKYRKIATKSSPE